MEGVPLEWGWGQGEVFDSRGAPERGSTRIVASPCPPSNISLLRGVSDAYFTPTPLKSFQWVKPTYYFNTYCTWNLLNNRDVASKIPSKLLHRHWHIACIWASMFSKRRRLFIRMIKQFVSATPLLILIPMLMINNGELFHISDI